MPAEHTENSETPDDVPERAATHWRPERRLIIREQLAYLRVVKLLTPPVRQPAAGRAIPVLLVPGFMSGDWSMVPLARRLRRRGHRTYSSGLAVNVGCTFDALDRLERRLELAAGTGQVAVVGQSRGGTLAKLLALRRPELVRAVIGLGAPNVDPLAVSTGVLDMIERLIRLNRAGLRSVLGEDCVRGECAGRVLTELSSPLPEHIDYTVLYSRSDGVVRWQACLDPQAEHIEVTSTHNGMGCNGTVSRIVAECLATGSALS